MHRRLCGVGAAIAGLACLTFAGTAAAAPSTYSGTVPNGGCDTGRAVTVPGSSRIEIQVSSTAGATNAYGEILKPDGSRAAVGSYDTPGAGTYTVRVCTYWDEENAPSIHYTATYATGPAGQSPMPAKAAQADQGGVLGATATLTNAIHGSAAVMTRAGLAWFTVKLNARGLGVVKVFDPVRNRHLLFSGAALKFGTGTVRITAGGMTLTVRHNGATERISFRSPHFKTSGKVVRGGFIVV